MICFFSRQEDGAQYADGAIKENRPASASEGGFFPRINAGLVGRAVKFHKIRFPEILVCQFFQDRRENPAETALRGVDVHEDGQGGSSRGFEDLDS